MLSASQILEALLAGENPSGVELLRMDMALKSVFFHNGFMAFAKKETQRHIDKEADKAVDAAFIEHVGRSSEDVLVESIYSVYASVYQSASQQMFYQLPAIFLRFDKRFEDSELNRLIDVLKRALKSRKIVTRTRAVMILGKFAESSDAQARRALAGSASTKTLEWFLKSINWRENEEYGKRFMYQNSVTDFTIPAVRDWHAYEVQAYIAIQSSTNDRAKLTASALHGGARRYLCSLNGCYASSKSTKDISDALARSFRESETFYVIVERERQEAIRDAKDRIKRHKGTKKEINARKRLDWLEKYTINYGQFLSELRALNVNYSGQKPKARQKGRKSKT